jgi:hypothetical protein
MSETFAEKERKVQAVLPTIKREEAEFHSALDALGNCAASLRSAHSEGTYSSVAAADQVTHTAANVQSFLQEGSVPLHTRFARLLTSVA